MNLTEVLSGNEWIITVIGEIMKFFSPYLILLITLYAGRKQNARYKMKEIKIEQLRECVNWLKELLEMECVVSRKAMDCLCASDPEMLRERRRKLSVSANIMMEKCVVGVSIYGAIANALGISFNISEVSNWTETFARKMRDVAKMRFTEQDEIAEDVLNEALRIYKNKIKELLDEVGKRLATILESK